MRALLLLNLQSRRGREMAPVLREELRRRGIETIDGRTRQAADVDCVISAGGDGTLTRAMAIAVGRDVPVGLVPLGTFNDLARTLNVPLDVAAACDVIGAGHTRTIDVSRVNGVYYASEASIGVSSRIARLQTSQEKQRFGMLAIVATALQAFRYVRPMRVSVAFDGKCESFKTVQLTVANSHRFGGVFNVSDAAIDDGWLDLYSVEIDNPGEALSVARAVLRGQRHDAPGLRTYRSTKFYVTARNRHHISADGEPAGKTPATFEVLPKALRVYVPQE
ncbi:MAG TPA: YegS/Rv2252/BmrU family lipid kinase [Candidatus Baltobacteraceae bacterium]|nr:YegS/Rv2252/BmrU family lipid kinase [Candidatus Baltobacteraceae bacterium]